MPNEAGAAMLTTLPNQLHKITTFIFAATLVLLSPVGSKRAPAAEKTNAPNIVFILADDLGYGDLGCYGQKRIKTPNIDRLATEGTRFRQCYAGSTVCAPSRCCLMTGLHTGHGRIRGNANVPLRPDDVTVAEVLKKAGYTAALVGKWGLGEAGSTGIPTRKGFDSFFGYLNQVHAHNYYPDFLWKNETKMPLEGNVVEKGVAKERKQYSADLFTREALEFLDRPHEKPYFLYLAYTLPHANNEAGNKGMEVPSDAPYSDESWPQPQKNHAAMITRLDTDVGKVLAKLKDRKLDENTIVFFSSDNGPHKEGGADPKFFESSGPLRGFKRAMHEGGIRVPMIVRWPGKVPAGATSDQVWTFWDFLPTAAELAGAKVPEGLDGISMLPALVGEKEAGRKPASHEFLYWEFHERGFHQAVRMGEWKYIRHPGGKNPGPELYDLKTDLGEAKNVAADNAEVIKTIEAYLEKARAESKDWPLKKR
jgi:arylsulfatase A-like enzyme